MAYSYEPIPNETADEPQPRRHGSRIAAVTGLLVCCGAVLMLGANSMRSSQQSSSASLLRAGGDRSAAIPAPAPPAFAPAVTPAPVLTSANAPAPVPENAPAPAPEPEIAPAPAPDEGGALSQPEPTAKPPPASAPSPDSNTLNQPMPTFFRDLAQPRPTVYPLKPRVPTPRPSHRTAVPTKGDQPSAAPVPVPTVTPGDPTVKPTRHPTVPPTVGPTDPTAAPVPKPTIAPTVGPDDPTLEPTRHPTIAPTAGPGDPTAAPVLAPTVKPTHHPSLSPTVGPDDPTAAPVPAPTAGPNDPTPAPSWAGKQVDSDATCTAAGGDSYNYCSDTGMYYCCDVCTGTDSCSSNPDLESCACTDPVEVAPTSSPSQKPTAPKPTPKPTSPTPAPSWAGKQVDSDATCTAAGGDSYNYCSDTGMYYCCDVCTGTDSCSSNPDLESCACTDPVEVAPTPSPVADPTPKPTPKPSTPLPTTPQIVYGEGTYGSASCSGEYTPYITVTYGTCEAIMYATCRDATDDSGCQVYSDSMSLGSAYMTVEWDDAPDSSTENLLGVAELEADACDMDIEVTTTWSVATDGSTMTLTVTLDAPDYDAGNSVYAGFELNNTTYEVTEDGSEDYTFTYTDCF